MSDKVIHLTVVPGDNYHADADAILEGAKDKLTHVVLIGWDRAGETYLAHSHGEADTNLLLDLAKKQIIDSHFEE